MGGTIERWAPRQAAWWIGALFIVGSACFALGATPPYAEAVGATGDGVTYFIGSLFFTSAAALQLSQAPTRAARWAGVVQFAGTLLFNRSTFQALHDNLTAAEANQHVWRPDMLGSIAFLVASALAYLDVRRPWITWRPRDVDWSVATLNMIGSIAFGISAVASYVVADSDTMRNAQRANLGTFIGALCFLAGAILILPRQQVVSEVSEVPDLDAG